MDFQRIIEIEALAESETVINKETFERLRDGSVFIAQADGAYFVHRIEHEGVTTFYSIVCSTLMKDDVETGEHQILLIADFTSLDLAIVHTLHQLTIDAGADDSIHQDIRDLAHYLKD